MMSPELGSAQVDYKAIGDKLLHSQDLMTKTEKEVIFSVGLKYAANLVEERASGLLNYGSQRPEIINYLDIAILGRIISLHRNALKECTPKEGVEIESVTAFESLRNQICEKLSMQCNELPDDSLNEFFDSLVGTSLDEEMKRINPEPKEMDFVRITLPKIIAENPPSERIETGIEHKLD